MPLFTLCGVLLGTAAEVAGLTLWRPYARASDSAGVLFLALGGAVGWGLSAGLVRYSPASHPRRAGTVRYALLLLAGLAGLKVALWVGWAGLTPLLGLTAATALLAAGFHLKHAVAVAAVSGRRFWPTLGNPLTAASTAAAAGGPVLWVALHDAGHAGWAAAALFAFLAAENVLQFAAGGMFDPEANAQSAFTILAEVRPDAAERVRAALAATGADPAAEFGRYDRLHFCSLVLLTESGVPPTLVFEGNVDGPPLTFLRQLAEGSAAFLAAAYSGCVGYPPDPSPAAVADFLAERDSGAAALYVGLPGMTLEQVRRDAELREAVEAELDRGYDRYSGLTPDQCREELRAFVRSQPRFAWAVTPVQPLLRVRYGGRLLAAASAAGLVAAAGVAWGLTAVDGTGPVLAAAAAAAAAAALAAVGYLVWLRRRERADVPITDVPPADLVAELQGREDLSLQNHLVSVSVVKPGRLRLVTLRAVLAAIDLLARYVATKGNLSGIVTIHFARWVVLPPPAAGRPRVLLFLSNYDGTWENYLGEFIDRASRGLTAVWSNTGLGPGRGFPRTAWLFVSGGSRDEQPFKNIVRLSQRTAGVWHSAYPGLSVKQIANNREFRAGLFGPAGDVREWLRRV